MIAPCPGQDSPVTCTTLRSPDSNNSAVLEIEIFPTDTKWNEAKNFLFSRYNGRQRNRSGQVMDKRRSK